MATFAVAGCRYTIHGNSAALSILLNGTPDPVNISGNATPGTGQFTLQRPWIVGGNVDVAAGPDLLTIGDRLTATLVTIKEGVDESSGRRFNKLY